MTTVYIIEDSPLIRNRLCESLAGMGAFRIVGTAESANEALADIDILDPDIVITDIQLKEGTGVEIVKQVRESRGRHRPRIYVLTNYAYPEYRDAMSRVGADGFFDKSAEYGSFLEEIRIAA